MVRCGPTGLPGVSIRAGGGHLRHWFNTAAFSTVLRPASYMARLRATPFPAPA